MNQKYTLFKDLPKDVDFNFEDGLIVGKFAPATKGHINFILKSASVCKQLNVVICYDDKWLSKQSSRDQLILTKEKRIQWLNDIFIGHPNINIQSIDETDLPAYPNGWSGYANLLRGLYPNNVIEQNTAIFSSEIEYSDGYEVHMPELHHVVVDSERVEYPISATMVRNELEKHFDFLPICVQKDYLPFVKADIMISDKISYIRNYEFHPLIQKRAFTEVEQRYNITIDDDIKKAIVESLKDYFICCLLTDKPVGMPSFLADQLWHTFIIYTLQYKDFCDKIGKFIHHSPEDLKEYSSKFDDKTVKHNKLLTVLRTYKLCCNLEDINPETAIYMPMIFNIDMVIDFDEQHFNDVHFLKEMYIKHKIEI